MKQIYPDLWQTPAIAPPERFTFHAYLLTRPEGNVLFGNPRSRADFEKIAELGGIKYQYLTHSHEVHDSLSEFAEAFGSTLCCHALVKPYLGDFEGETVYLEPKNQYHDKNIEVLNTPGHTNNNFCFRYQSPCGKTYIFVGDTIFLNYGEWKSIFVRGDGGDREELLKTLTEMKQWQIDVVACSVSMGRPMEVLEMSPASWRMTLEKAAESLKQQS